MVDFDVPGTTLDDGNAQLLALLEHPQALQQMHAPTGSETFDRYVVPLLGQLIVVGAEQGSGKSSYLLTLLLKAAGKGSRVALFSAEDVALRLRARLLGLQAGVNPFRIMTPSQRRPGDLAALRAASERNSGLPFTFFEGMTDVNQIMDNLEALARADCPFVAIDYLQSLKGVRSQDRRNDMLQITQMLAHFARANRMILLLASQVVRPESRKVGAEPTRHWLKEASDIADAADKIILLWRDQEGRDNSPTFVKLDKDKDGFNTGSRWHLRFDKDSGRLFETGLVHG